MRFFFVWTAQKWTTQSNRESANGTEAGVLIRRGRCYTECLILETQVRLMQESEEFNCRVSPSCASCIIHRSSIPFPPLLFRRRVIEAKIPKSLLMLTAAIILELTDQIRSLKNKRRRFAFARAATRYWVRSNRR